MFKNKDRGISPVLSVILMVAITLIAALGIAQFVLGFNLQDSVNAGVIIQETGDNTAEVVWDSNQNAKEILVKVNGVNQDTFTQVGDSKKISINNGDTISAVGVNGDKKSVVASKSFTDGIVENVGGNNNEFELTASSKENADGVFLIGGGDLSSETESDVTVSINGEEYNPDGTVTLSGIKFYKVYLNDYEGTQDYTIGVKPINSRVYPQYYFDSMYLNNLNPESDYEELDNDYKLVYPMNEVSEVSPSEYTNYISATGLGTEDNPKQITSKSLLSTAEKLTSSTNMSFSIQSDIDYSNNALRLETRNFNGNGYTISNISNDSGSDIIYGANKVENITFDNISSNGTGQTVFIDAEIVDNVKIKNSNLTTTLEEPIPDSYIGRAASFTALSDISNTVVTNTSITVNKGTYDSSSDFLTTGWAGGLSTQSNNISNSYFSGSVSGVGDSGGLAAKLSSDKSISNSYSTGSVSGEENAGGLVGLNNGTIENSYATGTVSGSSTGGLIEDNTGTVTDSYWDTEASGESSSDGGTGLTTSEMTGSNAESNMTGFDFSSTWDTVSGDYPELQNTP